MTPEKARELLRFAVDGPWEERPSEHCYCCLDVVSKDGVVVAKDSHNCDAPLIVAAPDLAELVAGLRYEYAAQVEQNGKKYIVTDSSTSGLWLCDDEVLQDWFPSLMDAEDYADAWNGSGKRGGTTAYTVRRLVGDPEVVE